MVDEKIDVEAKAPPQQCWNFVSFPGKCGFHGKKKCFKEMETMYKQRFLSCKCENKTEKKEDQHDCSCERENPYECNGNP